ncbi:UDP-N-acetylmuramoyl-tripeptide--D-alanyl-D-alanine ligase [Rhizobium sp. L1K21]|uniref:UDP-N-acetylmuramoyl-tripeptide--D-alanyl-D- alanine ligase n=1 Tax=Rhizobium sp. L1K21 TaxID=2954933 RepID=UPI002092D9A7|nr:UDP-N-acetylmuramoyl-tripeptide--D-alanyl-D-alanine ligase [Rhizobium sp. L1K21]MCO6185641.1 UDP-N-acetylmuramoyl-tripeptide--D-alanyl-D-alanine ligase [Rhizobium sp. L1K21]
MNYLWETDAFLAAVEGRPVGGSPAGITGISIDSRSITKGEAFFAIKGDRVDGHDYASVAAANGASVLVVSEARLPALGRLTVPLIVVDDVLTAMERLGRAARARVRGKVIGITGSVGKTTTKEMMRRALEPSGKVHASVASFNNHWGVPLTLSRMPADTDFGIFEIGMNHPGEIRSLVSMVRPDVAVITTVAGAHLGHFSGLDEIAAAKAEILEGIEVDGTAILNRDIAQYGILEKAAQENRVSHVVTFGADARADVRLAEYDAAPDHCTVWAVIGGHMREFTIGAPGRHIADNALAVIAAVQAAGGDVKAAMTALEGFSAGKGRGERHHLSLGAGEGSFTLIDESYNANPASMRAAISLLAASPVAGKGRRIAVLGDMLEMGDHAQAVHADLAGPLKDAGIADVWLAGPDMRALAEALGNDANVTYRAGAQEMAEFAISNVRDGDVLVVKSSLGTGFGKITAALLEKYAPADTAA